MKNLSLNEIREKYLAFFEQKSHYRMNSFSLVPQNDKSLLLINSGMAPFKPYFTGQETPPSKRVTTCQKCIRTIDLDIVGCTTRHGTFFEMLGNFSFGDYFKEEIIPWSWEFFIEVMEIPVEKLSVTVYHEDDEAYNIWHEKVGLPKEKIVRLGKEDNFWEVGVGPCGPCSEIYFDKGEEYGCGKETCKAGCDCERYMEVWNLVFTQFNKNEDGTYTQLAQKNIDTGMGLERIACVMQGVNSIFDVDTIKVIRDEVCKIASVAYNENKDKDVHIRIITDHIRSLTFMTADGIVPASDGRGYIFRRLLRRAMRHGKQLGIKGLFLSNLADVVISVSKSAYPELAEKADYIKKIISVEERRFVETLSQAMLILRAYIDKLKSDFSNVMWGTEAFRLYDTYGLPLDIMREVLAEEGITIDEASFEEEMRAQRERARAAREESTYMGAEATVYHKLPVSLAATEFVGYASTLCDDAKILAVISDNEIKDEASEGADVSIILDKTSFYAERGGQCGDVGLIKTETGVVQVKDCVVAVGNRFAHVGTVTEGVVKSGQSANTIVSSKDRLDVCRNHTATHLLHKALRDFLGTHVEQSGSRVDGNKLRFDFTHFSPISRNDLEIIEDSINEKILECIDVNVCEKSIDEARKMGAMALFGEKYGDVVRVVDVHGYSTELCGGTHVDNTAKIGSFNIISETGVAAGVRRIEAVTGRGALQYYKEMENKINLVSEVVKAMPSDVVQKMQYYVNQANELHAELKTLKSKIAGGIVDELMAQKEEIEGIPTIVAVVDQLDVSRLRELGDKIKDKLHSGLVVLASVVEGSVGLIVMATDDVVKKGIHAGNIVKETSAVLGGRGGGKPSMAQAGGCKDINRLDEALAKAREVAALQVK